MKLPRRFAQLLRPGPASESRQARWRLALAAALAPLLALAALLAPSSPEVDRAAAIALAGLLYATAWLAMLSGHGAGPTGRRWTTLVCDLMLIGALLSAGGTWTAPLYVLLITAMLDHGLRFNPRALLRAAIAATAVMAGVLALSPWWRGLGALSVALAGLPLAFAWALQPLRNALSGARRDARRSTQARHRLLHELDRDFRAPLDAIVGVAKSQFATRVSPEQREGAELVLGAAQSLLRRIGDTLDLAAADAGALISQPVDFNLRDGVARVRNSLQPLASARGLALRIEIDDALPARLRGDARRLWQVFARLLQDAIDRTEQGGVRASIGLAGTRDDAVDGEARAVADGFGSDDARRLRICVRDTGIDSEEARRHRREALRAGVQPDLVSALAVLLGGRSGIEPNPAGGVHAWAELPIAVSPVLPAADFDGEAKVVAFDDPLVRHRARVRPLRMLLADEPCANRLVLQRLLQRAGHDVVLADDGEQALERIEHGDVDAGIAHVRLAGMGGLDVLRYARMLQAGGRSLPLALLSADASPALVREAEAAGAFAFLPKPVQVPRLLEVLAQMSDAVRAPPNVAATPAPDAGAPAIGLDVVQELIALNLGEGFVASFVEQCLRDAGQCMAEMERCGGSGDWEGMREAAHALKGLGQNFNARAVADACDAVVRSGDLLLRNDWRRRVAQLDGLLQSCWRQVRAEMDRLALGMPSIDLDPGTEKR